MVAEAPPRPNPMAPDQSMASAAESRCDSCGGRVTDLVTVVRCYVVPESWDREGSTTEAEGTERWCFPCRTHYPHREV